MFMYSYIEEAEAENTVKISSFIHTDTQNMQDSYFNGIFAA